MRSARGAQRSINSDQAAWIGVDDRLCADIAARTIIDLDIRLLGNGDDGDDTAARRHQAGRHGLARKIERLGDAGLEQSPMASIGHVAGPTKIGRQLSISAQSWLGGQDWALIDKLGRAAVTGSPELASGVNHYFNQVQR